MASNSDAIGFDSGQIHARLRSFGIDSTDHRNADELQRLIVQPYEGQILRALCQAMRHDAAFEALLARDPSVPALLRRLTQQLVSFGMDFDTGGYFDVRLRAGSDHARAGVSISTCTWLASVLLRTLVDFIRRHASEAAVSLADFVTRITMLDLSIVSEGHRREDVGKLRRSLDDVRRSERRLRRQSRSDSLTGLSTRDYVLAVLAREMEVGDANGCGTSVIMLDLDHFKRINDTLGHAAGDQALRHVADRMRAALRRHDVIGRYGGEEFVVVLPQTPPAIAEIVAERMRREVREHPQVIEGGDVTVTVSQGIACARPGEDGAALVKRADGALYRAKLAGRDCIVTDDPVTHETTSAEPTGVTQIVPASRPRAPGSAQYRRARAHTDRVPIARDGTGSSDD